MTFAHCCRQGLKKNNDERRVPPPRCAPGLPASSAAVSLASVIRCRLEHHTCMETIALCGSTKTYRLWRLVAEELLVNLVDVRRARLGVSCVRL